MALGLERCGEACALVGMIFPGKLHRMRLGGGVRRAGLVFPDAIHEVVGAYERHLVPQLLFDLFELRDRVQPRVDGDARTVRGMVEDPIARLRLGPGHGCEMGQVDLMLDLRAIAAVDEHPRYLGQHDAEPGRAGKAGEPRQPVIARRDIFALMRVGPRHDEPVDPGLGHGRAQGGKARWPLFGTCSDLEGLVHRRSPRSCCAA